MAVTFTGTKLPQSELAEIQQELYQDSLTFRDRIVDIQEGHKSGTEVYESKATVTARAATSAGVPADGTAYMRGDVVGDAKVAYVGSGMSFTPRHVIANQNLYFAVYAFNGSDGFQNYKTSSPATGNVTTQGQQIGNYYSGINPNSTSFLSDLSALINPHNFVSYFNYKTTMMNQFEIRDTTAGQSYVLCV